MFHVCIIVRTIILLALLEISPSEIERLLVKLVTLAFKVMGVGRGRNKRGRETYEKNFQVFARIILAFVENVWSNFNGSFVFYLLCSCLVEIQIQ